MKNCKKDYSLSKEDVKGLKDFGYLIRIYKLLELNPITKKDLSSKIDIPESTLNKYLNKKIPIPMSIDCILKLSKYFNVSTDYLFGLTEVKEVDLSIRDMSKKLGLSELALRRLEQFREMGFSDLLSDFIFDPNFMSGLSQAYKTICLEIKDGYGYAYMSKNDADKMNEGERVTFEEVHSAVIHNMYLSKAKNDFCKAIDESINPYLEGKSDAPEETKAHIRKRFGSLG